VESTSLLQARLGMKAARAMAKDAARFVIEWVDESLHTSGIQQWEKSGKRRISFVDQISFLVMKRHNLSTAFAFDSDFEAEGFTLFEAE
jgi:predicted nucleic acid-binding protein